MREEDKLSITLVFFPTANSFLDISNIIDDVRENLKSIAKFTDLLRSSSTFYSKASFTICGNEVVKFYNIYYVQY